MPSATAACVYVCTCRNPSEFKQDMLQIFINCKTYNPPHDLVYKYVSKPVGLSIPPKPLTPRGESAVCGCYATSQPPAAW